MKDYDFYSMSEMMARYFRVHIDKQYQESFTLDADLIDDQINYAALDTRFPLALRLVQILILKGETFRKLKDRGSKAARYLEHIDPLVTGDDLQEIAQIENDAIGFFQDMHAHGERTDRERWLARITKKKAELTDLIFNTLDPIFIPTVGLKTDIITDEQIAEATAKWKAFNVVSDQEVQLKAQIRAAKKTDHASVDALMATVTGLVEARKAEKEHWKKIASDLGKRRTKIKNLAAKCEGNALINYGSDAQLLNVITGMRGLGRVTNLDDEALEKYENIPVMAAIRKYHGLSKEIGTYGDQWAMEWVTKPCKEEGWLHPGTGRLHCVFNQYDAETGRSSSEKPNAQNLPADKEVRECFLADEDDESVRISTCCDADVEIDGETQQYFCNTCHNSCDTKGEERVHITCDMSGAELRIIAELAKDPIWIGAFERDEDVHSVGTELLYEKEWPSFTKEGCAYFKLHTAETVAKNDKCVIGTPQKQKCKCPEHADLRGNNKSTNFLLAYGGGPGKLATEIKKSVQVAKDLMALHEKKNPAIWKYLENSGRDAKMLKKSFDMFGRRRLFPEPTNERAKERVIEKYEKRLELDDEVAAHNIETFTKINGRGPTPEELWPLTHRMPTGKEISKEYMGMSEGIGRQGKNHAIQGTNATIAKLSAGCGYDANGKPYLWHILPQYRARFIKFVHDELVISCPKRFAAIVAEEIQDAFRRAAATRMKRVIMKSEFNIAKYWSK
jgi:DNA polymerase I-like protein with 3'-5' exonuclease and polymerase domains